MATKKQSADAEALESWLALSGKDPKTEREASYRRGYSQGYFMALSDLDDGFSVEDLRRMVDKIMDWRFKRHQGKVEFPPELLKIASKKKPPK